MEEEINRILHAFTYFVRFPHALLYPSIMLIKEDTINDPWMALIVWLNLYKYPNQNNEDIS